MSRHELEAAIIELNQLLDANESDESQYQEYFETHAIVFEILGYKKKHTRN